MSETIHPFPQYRFLAWCSVKEQGQLMTPPFLLYAEASRKYKLVIILFNCGHAVDGSNAAIVGWNPTQGINICPRLSVLMVYYVGRGLASG